MFRYKIGGTLGLAILAGVVVAPTAAFAIPGLFPTTLSENTTGFSDDIFTGAPDDVDKGLGGQIVTYDFGTVRIFDGAGQDFNVYEHDVGTVEFDEIDVFVSLNGFDFFMVDGTEAAVVVIDGAEAHNDPAYARSYDISGTGLTSARYVRLDGVGDAPARDIGAQFDIDAIGAINFRSVAASVPAPSALTLLGLGLIGIGWARRRRQAA